MPSRRRFLRVFATTGLAGAAGCLSDPGTDSTTTPTGEVTPTVPDDTTDPTETMGPTGTRPESDRVDWSTSLSGAVVHRPALAGENLFVASEDGSVTALASADGSVRWRFAGDRANGDTPTVAGDTVLAVAEGVSQGGHDVLHTLDAESGTERWTFEGPSGWLATGPAWFDGLLYAGAGDGALYAVEADTGDPAWTFDDPSAGIATSPTVAAPGDGDGDARFTGVDR